MTIMAPDSGDENPRSRTIKITVAVVLLLAAGVLFYLRTKGGGEAQTDSTATPYVCPTDGTVREVTAAEFEKMYKTGEAGPAEGAKARTPGLFVRCTKCQKRIMVQAARCPTDGTVFPLQGPDGKANVCPKCKWKPPA